MVNESKANVSRLAREFSQTVPEKDTQSCQHTPHCHSLVPGMSQYSVSQEFSQVEGAVGNAENLSFSAGPSNFREADQESAADNLSFSAGLANSTEDFRVERCEFYELSP